MKIEKNCFFIGEYKYYFSLQLKLRGSFDENLFSQKNAENLLFYNYFPFKI